VNIAFLFRGNDPFFHHPKRGNNLDERAGILDILLIIPELRLKPAGEVTDRFVWRSGVELAGGWSYSNDCRLFLDGSASQNGVTGEDVGFRSADCRGHWFRTG